MSISAGSQRPAYVQVAADLREQIEAGKLQPGQRLPAGRELAEQYGVALMTVQNAIRVLRDQGLVTSQQGRGVFVREQRPEDRSAITREHSADYQQFMRQIGAVQDELRRVADRVAELEALAHRDDVPPPPRAH